MEQIIPLPGVMYWDWQQQARKQRLLGPSGWRIRLDGEDVDQIREQQGEADEVFISNDSPVLFSANGWRRNHRWRPFSAVSRASERRKLIDVCRWGGWCCPPRPMYGGIRRRGHGCAAPAAVECREAVRLHR